MTYYSQQGEDRWIVENLQLPVTGVFCEVGVGHSSHNSNSLAFELQGWTGILVEPDPRTVPEIRANRKAPVYQYAAGDHDGMISFCQEREPTLSGVLRTNGTRIDVQLRTLNTILAEAGLDRLDLLSIDTEGSELSVIAGLDWTRYSPSIVLVEYATIGVPQSPHFLLNEMLSKGYQLKHSTWGNFIFHK